MDGLMNQGGGHGKFTMPFDWRLCLKAEDGEKRERTPLAVSNGSETTFHHAS